MSGKLQEYIAALSKRDTPNTWIQDGVSLWTNGHVMVPGLWKNSRELDSVGRVWEKASQREDKWLSVGVKVYAGEKLFARKLFAEDGRVFVVNEAYWRMVADLGTPFGTVDTEAIAIRKDGALQALVMCLRIEPEEIQAVDAATDAEVFAAYSCERNDWYLQGAKKLRSELVKIEADIDRKEKSISDLEAEVRGLESVADALRRKITASKSAEAVV